MSTQPTDGPAQAPAPECSLIMKGGITSGVIYPRLASRLARDYRLHSIGGSSAGAIAAAAAAAAELRRLRDASWAGFARLDTLPGLLNEQVAGRSRLLSLFQPAPRTKPLFGVLLAVLDAQQAAKKKARAGAPVGATLAGAAPGSTKAPGSALLLAAVRGLVAGYPAAALLGALPGVALIGWGVVAGGAALAIGLIGGLTLLVVGLAVALVLAVKRTLTVDVAANHFGLCSGAGGTPDAPALTDWLHDYLQETAAQADPVTYGDLAGHDIELRMMTTNLTQGRPMAMPWAEGGFFFDPAVWRTLFPEAVVSWMVDHPPSLPARAAESAKQAALIAQARARGLAPLPDPDHLPIVVGVRMSLSFPLLFSAIPLVAVRWRSDGAAEFVTNWFTDGGLCANLPVHFFDRPLATRPTFAIDLQSTGSRVATPEAGSYLPQENNAGLSRTWTSWTTTDPGGLGAFVGAMVETWQGWVDNEALRMPGYRDRVVTIYSTADEGGMNLNMESGTVTALADRGEAAAAKLVAKFAGPFGAAPNTGFDNHRWVRLRAALAGVSDWLEDFAEDLDRPAAGAALTHRQLLAAGEDGLPSYGEGSLAQVRALAEELTRLAASPTEGVTRGAPNPRGHLRLVPDSR
nr:hypothetical protein [Propionibacterium sp.]